MKDDNNRFDWGETVRVKDIAPINFYPGEIVSICGMIKTKSKVLADKYKVNIGEWIYIIEYMGGSALEIPEIYLEKYQEP